MKYEITCEECDANFDVLSDLIERVDFCPFCGESIPIEPDGWDEEEDSLLKEDLNLFLLHLNEVLQILPPLPLLFDY